MTETPERLRAVDSLWLDADYSGPPIAIGGLVVGDGEGPTLDEIKHNVRERLPKMPRLLQRVVPGQAGVKRPMWETVADVDLDAHITAIQVAEPGDRAAIDEAVSRVMEAALPENAPLWDMHLLEGVADGWAIVTRMHHAVADGEGAVLLMGRIIDVDPDGNLSLTDALAQFVQAAAAAKADAGESGEKPSPRDQLAQAAAKGGDFVLRALRKGVSTEDLAAAVEATKTKVADAADKVSKAAEAASTVRASKPGSLAGAPGDTRTWVSVSIPFGDVRVIRKAIGGTVNDVVMTLMTGGYRKLLETRGEDIDSRIVRAIIPVSLRMPGDLAANNQVSGLLVMLPLAGDEPARLEEIHRHIGVLKELGVAGVGKVLFDLNDAVPAVAQSLVVRTFDQLPAVISETLVTNVPGPQFPVYVHGRRVKWLTPIIPLGGFLRISTGILSYDGNLNFGISGGADAGEDVHLVREGIEEAHANLMRESASRS